MIDYITSYESNPEVSLMLKFDLKVYLRETKYGASLAPTVDHNGYSQLYWSDLFYFEFFGLGTRL